MKVLYVKYIHTIVLLWIVSVLTLNIGGCSPEDTSDYDLINDFSNVRNQQLSERVIMDTLVPKDSIMLSEKYGMIHPRSELKTDTEMLYILDESYPHRLFSIGKDTFELADTFSVTTGRGPGEVSSIQDYEVYKDFIIFNDRDLSKVQIRNKDGDLVNEFITEGYYPYRTSYWGDGTLAFLSHQSMYTGSIFYTMDQDGNLLNSFGNALGEPFNPIRFGGSIFAEDEFLYYAGYSEHLLGKWDREGELHYMVTTIDDFPGETNLITTEGASPEQGMFGFVPGGFFSAVSATVYKDYLILVHLGFWEEDYEQFLDIYNKHNGQYMISLQMPYRIGHIDIDDEHIYALPSIDEERYLFIYENTLEELLSEEPVTK